MIKTTLNRRSSFFIDAFNVIAHIDLFLYNELWFRISKGDKLLIDLFSKSLPPDWNKTGYYSSNTKDISIIKLVSSKSNQNILFDLIDKAVFKELDIGKPINVFVASLYYDFLMNPTCPDYIQFTEFGHTMRLLLADTNLDKICLYMPFKSEFVCNNILDSFAGVGISKIKLIFGDKTPYLLNNKFDTYVFENVTDIDNILFENVKSRIEILIPTYEYNMVDDRTDSEKLIEQITYQRLNLKRSPEEYRDKGIIISSMSVPL